MTTYIPKIVKDKVWVTYIGENFKSPCPSCNLYEITALHFYIGHIIPKCRGGNDTIDNLRPICDTCNLSIGNKNMFDFLRTYFPDSSILSTISNLDELGCEKCCCRFSSQQRRDYHCKKSLYNKM